MSGFVMVEEAEAAVFAAARSSPGVAEGGPNGSRQGKKRRSVMPRRFVSAMNFGLLNKRNSWQENL